MSVDLALPPVSGCGLSKALIRASGEGGGGGMCSISDDECYRYLSLVETGEGEGEGSRLWSSLQKISRYFIYFS
jgi:hypothetical protein